MPKLIEFYPELQGRPESKVMLDLEGRQPSIPSGHVRANMVELLNLPGATYDDVQALINNTLSAGRTSGGAIEASGASGDIKVNLGTGFIKITDSAIGVTKSFDWDDTVISAGVSAGDIIDLDVNYIYIDYNAGSPVPKATTDRTAIELNRMFTIGRVYRSGTTLHIVNSGIKLYNHTRDNYERLIQVRGFERASGGVIAETGNRYLTATAGVFFLGAGEITNVQQDTAPNDTPDVLTRWYHDGGENWVSNTSTEGASAAGQISNEHYDTGAGLDDIGTARYGVFWIFIHYDGDLHVVYGRESYKLAEAEQAIVPDLPEALCDCFSILAAKIIVAKDDPNFTSIVTAYETLFPVSSPPNHWDLGGLQGGTTDEYYHLTSARHTLLATDLTATAAELNVLDGGAWAAGEVLRATGANAMGFGSDLVKLVAPDISGSVTAASALTFPAFNTSGAITLPNNTYLQSLNAASAPRGMLKMGANNIVYLDNVTGAPIIIGTVGGAITLVTAVTLGSILALGGKLTAGANEIEGSAFDINGGTIDGVTITAPVLDGTVTNTGAALVLPAFTAGGQITLGADVECAGYGLYNLDVLSGINSTFFTIRSDAPDQYLYLQCYRNAANAGGAFYLATRNSIDAFINRLALTGGVDVAIATWLGVTHTGLVLSGALDANSQDITNIGTLSAFIAGGNITLGAGDLITTTTTPMELRAKRQNTDNALYIYTPGAGAGYADTQRLLLTGRAAEATAAWSNIIHTGIKLGGALDANSQDINNVAAPDAAGDPLIKGTRVTADELPAVTDEYYLVGTGATMEERAVPVVGAAALTVTFFQENAATGDFAATPERINDNNTGNFGRANAENQYAEVDFGRNFSIYRWRQYGNANNNGTGRWKIGYYDGAWHDWVTGIATRNAASWSAFSDESEVVCSKIRLTCTTVDSGVPSSYIAELEITY